MDHFEKANAYHKQGFNCCQSVLAAFSDITGLTEQASFDIGGGFGAGAGTGELCGAISGALLVLGLLYPHTQGEDREAKRKVFDLAKRFRQRFFETFGHTRCGNLLRARCGVSEETTAARLGLPAHCDIMVVTAVEILEALLRETA